jgi:hypothetical protein
MTVRLRTWWHNIINIPTWVSGALYSVGNYVIYNSISYRCIKATTSAYEAPTNTTYWTQDIKVQDLLVGTVTVEAYMTYTLSFYAKGSGMINTFLRYSACMGSICRMGGESLDSNGCNWLDAPSEWTKITVNFSTYTSGGSKEVVIRQVGEGSVSIAGVKFEKYGLATDGLSKSDLYATGIDIQRHKITATSDNFYIQNNSGTTTFSVDENGNIVGAGNASFKGAVYASSGEFTNGTFTNCTVGGTLNGVSGSFKELYTIDSKGNKTATIKFGTYGEGIGFERCDFYMQGTRTVNGVSRSQRFYSSDIWCRGTFGARERTIAVIVGSQCTIYTDETLDSSHSVVVTLASGTDSNGNTYYTIPCYGLTGDARGMPIDTVIIRNTTVYNYVLDLGSTQRVMMLNANNSCAYYVYINGNRTAILVPSIFVQKIWNLILPAVSTSILGANQIMGKLSE